MKKKRHEKILELINEFSIDTQDELLDRLKKSGFDATQATVSRDIRELKIVKVALGKNKSKYVSKSEDGSTTIENRYLFIIKETVRTVDFALNIVVIKALTGMASAAGAAIDAMKLSGVVGSVAGDDTLILIARTEQIAKRICDELQKDIQ
ncbi:MAG: arginine repressor [Clostridia bacterium]